MAGCTSAPPSESLWKGLDNASTWQAIDMAQGLGALPAVKATVVVHPTAYGGVHQRREVFQGLIVPGCREFPATHRGPDSLGGLRAHRREEAHEELPEAIPGPPRLKRIPQKVEPHMFVVSGAVVILAVDDAGLLRMEFQTARLQPSPYRVQDLPSLRFTVAVNEAVVGISLKLHVRIVPPKPVIQRMMEEHVRNDGTEDPALRCPSSPLPERSIR